MATGSRKRDENPATTPGGRLLTATDFSVTLEDRPGEAARVAKTLGDANINIVGAMGAVARGQGIVRLLTSNPDGARRALQAANIPTVAREVLVITPAGKDTPGKLAQVLGSLAAAGVNLLAMYATVDGRVVLDTDNVQKASQVLSQFGRE